MVAKIKAAKANRSLLTKKGSTLKKIRIGVLVGKDFDPVKKDTHPPEFPKKFILTEDDWDLLEVDIIPGKEISEQRLKKNHVNLNFWYDIGVAMMAGGKQHVENVTKVHKNPDCRLDPSWDYYDWVLCKPRYMEQCQKAGIPTIPTVIYKDGLNAQQLLKDVQKRGWEKFLVKVGHFAFFGAGAIHGKTEDFFEKRAKDLDQYIKDNKKSSVFLAQPYTLKPNGDVFDEVRNFFIDGQWRYSVFTHGTDETDAGYYMEPDGPRKEACKAMAERAYQEVLKTASWQGKRQTPLLNRIDIGVIPKKGADSKHRTDNTYFLNEIELICTTWLDRYSPISVSDSMAQASVKHSLELLVGLDNANKLPEKAEVKKTMAMLNQRVGPFKHLKL